LKIRNAVAANTKDFLKIVNGKPFKTHFGDLDGERLTKPPKGFPADHEAIEYLKLKSFTVSEEFDAKAALSGDYVKKLEDSFKTAYPLNEFLRKAFK
ncbi:MAG TPA: DUF2461 family protein, partial [Pyrinomonadaceae bacterium]|jgi:uncharacterized protein (DUF2461 family)|nr:DUF2461 family protein [Pyrinomonadaceae bacterium]